MKSIHKKEKVQRKALACWLKAGKKGTCQIVTGLGKTFIALHALYTMPFDKSITHLFLAEVKDRKEDLLREIAKYNLIFKRDVLKDYNLQFACYQKAYKIHNRELGLVICDEIPDGLTPSYSQFFFNNKYKAIIGLTAKVKQSTSYIIGDKVVTKGGLLKRIAPICFNYTLKDSLKDETTRDLKIHVIRHKLDTTTKTIDVKKGNRNFSITEARSYQYWQDRYNKSFFAPTEPDRLREFNKSRNERARLLYDLPSKIDIVSKLLYKLDTKSIIFSNSIQSLLNVTPNVVSHINTESQNEYIKNKFNSGLIDTIGSFKKLKQGANLNNLDNCIVMSYYSNSEDLLQRIGRLRDNNKVGHVYIIVTEDTQEKIWFDAMISYYQMIGEIIYYKNIDECLEKTC